MFLLPLVAHTKKQIKTNNINIMSIKSPKNKYSAVITLDKASKEIGSRVTFTSNDRSPEKDCKRPMRLH